MGKRILILSASPRKNGNTSLLCREFARGAKESGHEVTHIFLKDKKIAYCIACRYCRSHGGDCVQKDDMAEINQEMLAADVLVLASPVYYNNISAQMKTVIDRTFGCFTEMKGKELYYIMASSDEGEEATDTALAGFHWFAHFLPGSVEKGTVLARGFRDAGAVEGSPFMQEAYDMGKNS